MKYFFRSILSKINMSLLFHNY